MKHLYLLAAALLALAPRAHAQQVPPIPTDSTVKVIDTPAGYTTQLNTVYSKVGPWDGRVDLYLNTDSRKPVPVIINLHGGGWNKGTKESQSGFNGFFKQGWSVANVEYRLSTYAPAPAAVEDVRCAIIYLITNAKKLNIDPSRIVIMGSSSGGHLALVGGLLENDHVFDTQCPTKETVKLRAIIDKYGIADVPQWNSKSATQWLGSHASDAAFVRSVSPLYMVKKTSPPTFIVHGDADPTVPYEQSVALHKAYVAAGVPTEFITIAGGQHGKFSKDDNKRVNEAIIRFLKAQGL
ncbi:alpha/beta hydrolase fold domain-containing protein [Hymenobacter artigasi]|uniref:Acetyl esterase/lipase n=1 Tax=Hymenobacter artigasi TaxID=2719616 RepID=A0ABX1HL39_9BACT|nr:alpha/beta hydrolase [Hymenobacter artigasi]NKI90976.1 acetyl esterase/lipase [Hymenobacter artigasi]